MVSGWYQDDEDDGAEMWYTGKRGPRGLCQRRCMACRSRTRGGRPRIGENGSRLQPVAQQRATLLCAACRAAVQGRLEAGSAAAAHMARTCAYCAETLLRN